MKTLSQIIGIKLNTVHAANFIELREWAELHSTYVNYSGDCASFSSENYEFTFKIDLDMDVDCVEGFTGSVLSYAPTTIHYQTGFCKTLNECLKLLAGFVKEVKQQELEDAKEAKKQEDEEKARIAAEALASEPAKRKPAKAEAHEEHVEPAPTRTSRKPVVKEEEHVTAPAAPTRTRRVVHMNDK